MGRVQPRRLDEHREGQLERREDRQRDAVGHPASAGSICGAGLISTTTGVFTFLLFLLLAVQVAYNLYATTMVTSAAHDAARRAAGASRANDPDAEARATERVKELLGRYGDEHVESVDLETDGEHLALRVVAKNPSLLPPVIRRPLGFDRIDRTVRIRLEREIAP